MTITYKKGNLLEQPDIKFILHGCNSLGKMGAGFAKQIKNKYPEIFDPYETFCKENKNTLGEIVVVKTKTNLVVLNAITQHNVGIGRKQVSYDAVHEIFSKLNRLPTTRIDMPKLGAGLGGGDWRVIEAIINSACPSQDFYVWEF